MVGVGIVVDSPFVTSGCVSQNSSVAMLNEVTMTVGINAVGIHLLVVPRTYVMCQLMAKAVISKGAALLTDGEGSS